MSFLTPCEGCHRHVLASESRCPFCDALVTSAMRVPRPTLVRSRVGRAAMLVLSSTAAGSAAACGGDSDDDRSREQASEANEPGPSGTAANDRGDAPATSTGGAPNTDEPNDGNPTTTPDDEPMAVAEYGVAILPPTDDPNGQNMAQVDPPPPDPDLVPRPVYGAPAMTPVPSAPAAPTTPPRPSPEPVPEPEPPPALDAGLPVTAEDAGAPEGDAGVVPEVVPPEPEPMVQPAYGVGILPPTE